MQVTGLELRTAGVESDRTANRDKTEQLVY